MKIKLTDANKIKIEAILKEVNGRADAHTYTRFGDLLGVAHRAEKTLINLGLAKSNHKGAFYVSESGNETPSAYKYPHVITSVKIERFSTGWFIVGAFQDELWPRQAPSQSVYITDEQETLILQKLRSQYKVIKLTEEVVA